MKWDTSQKLHKLDKMYGTTTLGARGQLVIPSEARKDLGLKPGDQMLVLGRFGKMLALLKADQLEEILEMILAQIPENKKKLKNHIRNHLVEVFGGNK